MSEKSEADPWDFLTPRVSSSPTESDSVAAESSSEIPKVDSDGDDPWSFLTARKAEVAAREDSGVVPEALVEKREAGNSARIWVANPSSVGRFPWRYAWLWCR